MSADQIIWFVLGASLGSFSLLVVSRYPRGGLKASFKGRSKCDSCQRQLGVVDLAPIVGYLINGAKCRWCGAKISSAYPIWELLFGALAVGLSLYFNDPIQLIIDLSIITILLTIAGIDGLTMEIDEKLIYLCLAVVVVEIILLRLPLMPHIYGLIASVGALFALVFLGKGKLMGGGDILVGGLIGFWLGYPLVAIVLLLAFIFGGLYGGVLLAQKKATMKTALPFAPFIVLGAILTLLYGTNMLNWMTGGW